MADSLLSQRAQALIDAAKGGVSPALLVKHGAALVSQPPALVSPLLPEGTSELSRSDALLSELAPGAPTLAPLPPVVTVIGVDGTRTVVGPPTSVPVLTYSPIGMVEFLCAHPELSLKQIAAAYGRTMSWLSTIVASDQFQRALDPRRSEVMDPFFTSTMNERFQALALRSGHILLEKLNLADVSDHVVLKATELSIKALGMGIAPPVVAEPVERKLTVAEKMQAAMDEMDKRQAARTLDLDLKEVTGAVE